MTTALATDETIAAIATAIAAGQGGIAIIRISGPEAVVVGKSVVTISGNKKWDSHTVLYGHVIDTKNKTHIDEVLVLIMKAPRSFTGEDVVELHCHGGVIAVQQVLERVLAHAKVRRAFPGEFCQRAVLNGRIDLTQAEGISELVGARSQQAAQLAMAGINGGIQLRITKLREKLLDQLSELEARVDFEDELPQLEASKVLSEINTVQTELDELIEEGKRGEYFRKGLKVALIGCPNVGKSSLLNKLSRKEKAIVTDLPGTTRDLLENEVVLSGVPIILLDTAGFRPTKDKIEKLGIEKSQQALISADVVVLVFDLCAGWTNDDQKLLEKIPQNTPKLLVGNKSDLIEEGNMIENNLAREKFPPHVIFSALTGKGEEVLIQTLLGTCNAEQCQSLEVALNDRQRDLAGIASAALERTKDVAENQLPWDFWTIDLRDAIKSLGEITGSEITEEVLERVFARFCIGK